jgi:hypothetical protein
MILGPSVAEERAKSLASRGIETTIPWKNNWKSNGMVLRAVFFVLTIVCVAAVALLFETLHLPRYIPAAIMCIVVAESLIQGKRFFGTGIESALWASALVLCILALPSSGRVEAFLVFALAAAIIGARMRSAFFGVIAATLVVVYAGEKWGTVAPIVAGGVFGLIGAIALAREWKRESTEELFAAMAIVTPAAGYITSLFEKVEKSRWEIAAAFAIGGGAAMFAAIRLRSRAMIVAASAAIAIAAVEARDLIDASVETKQIIAGIALIAIARAIAYALRDRKDGFVVTPSSMTRYDEAIQLIGAVAVPPVSGPAQGGPKIESGGSSFGGAGSGGAY